MEMGDLENVVKRDWNPRVSQACPDLTPRTKESKNQDISCHTSSHASHARYGACCEDVE